MLKNKPISIFWSLKTKAPNFAIFVSLVASVDAISLPESSVVSLSHWIYNASFWYWWLFFGVVVPRLPKLKAIYMLPTEEDATMPLFLPLLSNRTIFPYNSTILLSSSLLMTSVSCTDTFLTRSMKLWNVETGVNHFVVVYTTSFILSNIFLPSNDAVLPNLFVKANLIWFSIFTKSNFAAWSTFFDHFFIAPTVSQTRPWLTSPAN